MHLAPHRLRLHASVLAVLALAIAFVSVAGALSVVGGRMLADVVDDCAERAGSSRAPSRAGSRAIFAG